MTVSTTNENALDSHAAKTLPLERIPQLVFDLWTEGKLADAADLFDNCFTFTDHALGLAFLDKTRLVEFFQKTRQLFPDSVTQIETLFCCGDHSVMEWTRTATDHQFLGGAQVLKIPVSVRGASIVETRNGKIHHWADYYDRLKSRREALVAHFTEWIEL